MQQRRDGGLALLLWAALCMPYPSCPSAYLDAAGSVL